MTPKLLGFLIYLLVAPALLVWAINVLFHTGVALTPVSWAAAFVLVLPSTGLWCAFQNLQSRLK